MATLRPRKTVRKLDLGLAIAAEGVNHQRWAEQLELHRDADAEIVRLKRVFERASAAAIFKRLLPATAVNGAAGFIWICRIVQNCVATRLGAAVSVPVTVARQGSCVVFLH